MNGIQTMTKILWTLKFAHLIQLKAVQLMHLLKLHIRNVLQVKHHVITLILNCTKGVAIIHNLSSMYSSQYFYLDFIINMHVCCYIQPVCKYTYTF